MSQAVLVPNFDRLRVIKTGHDQKKEAQFEVDLRILISQLTQKLQKDKKMLKKMKKKSKKGLDQCRLTKFRFESRSPLANHSANEQRWMLFRASWDLWKVLETFYGKGFSFKIQSNSTKGSLVKYNLYMSWREKDQNDILHTINSFERPAGLLHDPRDQYKLRKQVSDQSLLLQEQKRKMEHQEELASIPAPTHQAPRRISPRASRPPLPRDLSSEDWRQYQVRQRQMDNVYVSEHDYGEVSRSELGRFDTKTSYDDSDTESTSSLDKV